MGQRSRGTRLEELERSIERLGQQLERLDHRLDEPEHLDHRLDEINENLEQSRREQFGEWQTLGFFLAIGFVAWSATTGRCG